MTLDIFVSHSFLPRLAFPTQLIYKIGSTEELFSSSSYYMVPPLFTPCVKSGSFPCCRSATSHCHHHVADIINTMFLSPSLSYHCQSRRPALPRRKQTHNIALSVHLLNGCIYRCRIFTQAINFPYLAGHTN
jgi:hypothetical protein